MVSQTDDLITRKTRSMSPDDAPGDAVLCAREKDMLEVELVQWMEALEKSGNGSA